MSITPDRAAAHEALGAAVHQLINTYNVFDQGQMVLSYVLILGGTRFMSPELDEDFEHDEGDEDEPVGSIRAFVRRGQQPIITRGLIECYRDRWESS